jgi:hypothetical protein
MKKTFLLLAAAFMASVTNGQVVSGAAPKNKLVVPGQKSQVLLSQKNRAFIPGPVRPSHSGDKTTTAPMRWYDYS